MTCETHGSMTRAECVAYLTARWTEQCDRWPMMRDSIPLGLYVRRNLPATLRYHRPA